jgi:hypothetical protein
MSPARIRKSTLIVLSLLLALAALSLAPRPAAPGAPAAAGNAIALKPPPFVQPAYAQEGTDTAEAAAAPMGFPQDEAGIAAYFKSASPVNLANVRGVYRVIEVQTADYIIGSVAVPDYSEMFDVHVYVHRDGWFMAYYLGSEPAAKMVDLRRSSGSQIRTMFEQVLSTVAVAAGVPMPQLTFYDFRYPNATNMMLIYENNGDGNNFTVQLPSAFVYYERSWSLINWGYGWYFSINGQGQSNMAGTNPVYNFIAPAQLLPDTTHTIAVDDDGVLALIYRVP